MRPGSASLQRTCAQKEKLGQSWPSSQGVVSRRLQRRPYQRGERCGLQHERSRLPLSKPSQYPSRKPATKPAWKVRDTPHGIDSGRVEVFAGDRLVGGIYGVAIGRMFFGESMFSGDSGGSKVAIAGMAAFLRERDWPLIDAQVENPHLLTLGAEACPRAQFLAQIADLVAREGLPGPWTDTFGERRAAALA